MTNHPLPRAGLALAALFLSACAAFQPVPVMDATTLANASKRFEGLPKPHDIATAKETLYGYANAYTSEAGKRYEWRYTAADATAGGGLLGIIGGLTKSPEAAIAGAAIGGLGSASAERYAFQIQAKNYEGAADAMECMADVLEYAKADDEIDFVDLNQRINDVRRKLRKNQAAIDIAAADTSALENALKDAAKARDDQKNADRGFVAAQVEEATAKSAKAMNAGNLGIDAQLLQAQAKLRLAEAAATEAAKEAHRAEFKKCVTAY